MVGDGTLSLKSVQAEAVAPVFQFPGAPLMASVGVLFGENVGCFVKQGNDILPFASVCTAGTALSGAGRQTLGQH